MAPESTRCAASGNSASPAATRCSSGAAAIALVVAILEPAWSERYDYARTSARYIDKQQHVRRDAGPGGRQAPRDVRGLGGGRVYAGLRSNWGEQYTVGYVPMYAWLADHDVDQVGFTFRTHQLPLDRHRGDVRRDEPRAVRDARDPVLAASGRSPAARSGDAHRERRRQVGSTASPRRATSKSSIGRRRSPRTGPTSSRPRWHGGAPTSRSTTSIPASPSPAAQPRADAGWTAGPPGVSCRQTEDLAGGVFSATVEMRRSAVVLLKASYDPSWTATVDGRSVRPVMMAPSLVGVEVGPGTSSRSLPVRPLCCVSGLFAIGLFGALALAMLPRRPKRGLKPLCRSESTSVPRLTRLHSPFTVPPVGL